LYIDTGDRDQNKGFFDALIAQREDLTTRLGEGLVWERLDTKRACRIYVPREVPSTPAPDENSDLRSWAVETMVRWNDVLRPVIRNLVVDVVIPSALAPNDVVPDPESWPEGSDAEREHWPQM
jgi:hypothetical protein